MSGFFGEEIGNLPDSQWREWMYSDPGLQGHEYVEACRFDGIWPAPRVIRVGDDPALNVCGLKWRPARNII